MIRSRLSLLRCCKCGGTNVQVLAWVDANTDKFCVDADNDDYESRWCADCMENTWLATLPELWEQFEDVPVNSDDEIEQSFLSFPAGTSRFDVWHWFDERCPNNLHDDLMFPKSK